MSTIILPTTPVETSAVKSVNQKLSDVLSQESLISLIKEENIALPILNQFHQDRVELKMSQFWLNCAKVEKISSNGEDFFRLNLKLSCCVDGRVSASLEMPQPPRGGSVENGEKQKLRHMNLYGNILFPVSMFSEKEIAALEKAAEIYQQYGNNLPYDQAPSIFFSFSEGGYFKFSLSAYRGKKSQKLKLGLSQVSLKGFTLCGDGLGNGGEVLSEDSPVIQVEAPINWAKLLDSFQAEGESAGM